MTLEYFWTRFMSDLELARTLCNRLLRTAGIYAVSIAGFAIIDMLRIRQWQDPLDWFWSAVTSVTFICAWLSLETWAKRLPMSISMLSMGGYIAAYKLTKFTPTYGHFRLFFCAYILCALWSLWLEVKPAKGIKPATKNRLNLIEGTAAFERGKEMVRSLAIVKKT